MDTSGLETGDENGFLTVSIKTLSVIVLFLVGMHEITVHTLKCNY